ncbi:MAG: glycosyltransferase family 9 protein, partial [Chthoniobacteraceae bacterium]
RILVIRGGAIGDFVLTLPAIRMLRQTLPHCGLEILGYRHIADIALHGGPEEGKTYADAVRSIEYGPLAAFFARGGQLAPDLCEYFAGFQQVVSWLFDPDGIFAANLERAGVRNYLGVYEKITDQPHASLQLARGLERMAIFLEDPVARLFPNAVSKDAADAWLAGHGLEKDARPLVALHPGSGSPRKNWPAGNWQRLADRVAEAGSRLLLIGGEADNAVLDPLAKALAIHQPLVARNLPLPTLAALLTRCAAYFGHDTGISHIAAAAGTPSTLLFGPTNPATWAPQGLHIRILTAPGGNLAALAPDSVPLPAQ